MFRRRCSGIALIWVAAFGACDSGNKDNQTALPPPAEVTVSFPLVQEVTNSINLTGTTEALESVEIRARVTGFLEKVHFEPRAKVKKGDVLFSIDSRPFEHALNSAKATMEAHQSDLVKAKFDAEKVSALYEKGNAAQDEFVEKNTRRDALIAEIAKDEAEVQAAQLNLDWCNVTASISGRISREFVDPGNVITADTTLLANIVNDESIHAYANVSERDILLIRDQIRREQGSTSEKPAALPEIRSVHWPAFLEMSTEQGYPHQGELDYTAPQVDAGTGTVQVRAIFANPNSYLLAGLFVRLRVPIGKPQNAMLVTERALGSDQGQRYLFVVNEKDVVEYRPVKVGSLQEGLRVIEAGITEKDRVIVNGIQRVRPGVTVKPVSAPMPVQPGKTTVDAAAAKTDNSASPTPASRPNGN